MADKEEAPSGGGGGGGGGNAATRGADWEVVSLTASAYAASPGPKPVQSKDDDDDDNKDVTTPPSEAEASHPLYMSRHFVFPSSEEHHTNLESSDLPEDKASKKMDSEFSLDQEDTQTRGKEEDGGDLTTLKGLDLAKDDDELSGLDIYNKTSLQEDERAFGGSHVYQHTEPVHEQTDITPDVSPDLEDDDKHHQVAAAAAAAAANSPPPCEPWWKRSAASLISQAKETNTVWSIFIAAAVMGVVVLGQRWQHDRWQILQLNWDSSIANEKAGRLMGPISRLKQAFVGGQRRDSFIRASSENDG